MSNYIGANIEVPIYETAMTTVSKVLSVANVEDLFEITTGTDTYTSWTIIAGETEEGIKLQPGNLSSASGNGKTATITMVAEHDTTGIKVSGSYTTGMNSTLTMTIGETTVLNAVTGTATLEDQTSYDLSAGESIVITYAKKIANATSVDLYITCDPISYEAESQIQVGSETKKMTKPIENIYVGVVSDVPIYGEQETTAAYPFKMLNFDKFFSVAYAAEANKTDKFSYTFADVDDAGGSMTCTATCLYSSGTIIFQLTALQDITNLTILGKTNRNSSTYHTAKIQIGDSSSVSFRATSNVTCCSGQSLAAGDTITITMQNTYPSSTANYQLIGILTISCDPVEITTIKKVQTGTERKPVAKKVKKGYVGVKKTVPIYQITTVEEILSLENLDSFFTSTTGTTDSTKWTITDDSSGKIKLVPGNIGVNSTTATITLTATHDLTNVIISGAYYTESGYDKITLTVAGTTQLSAVSGTSALADRYTGSLSTGQTIVLSYVKDVSNSATNEASTTFYITCDSYEKTDKIIINYEEKPVATSFIKPPLIASYTGDYTKEKITINGTAYEMDTLLTSGELQLNRGATAWICGGGANASYQLGGCGSNIAQSYISDIDQTYVITVGAAGESTTIAQSDGTALLAASGGTTSTGGNGRGGYYQYYDDSGSLRTAVTAEATNTIPFGLEQLDACCAGAGSGSYYGNIIYTGGDGGSSGVAATEAARTSTLTEADVALGGAKGGGNGGVATSSITIEATSGSYYGAGGGGAWAKYGNTTLTHYGTAGNGYQGVVFLLDKIQDSAHQHTKGSNTITSQPDCYNTGTVVYKCAECGEEYLTETIAALGHYYQVCEDDSTKKQCIRCGLKVNV